MSNMLIADKPIQVLPSLAVAIGLNEAIFIQQLHYWLNEARKSGKFGRTREGRVWIYNTPEDWQAQNFPFWSVSTIRRVISSCKSQGVLEVEMERSPMVPGGRRNWYTVNYDKVAEIGSVQNEQTGVFNLNRPSVQNEQTIYIEAETTAETTNKPMAVSPSGEQPATDPKPDVVEQASMEQQPELPDMPEKPKRKSSEKQIRLQAMVTAILEGLMLNPESTPESRYNNLRKYAKILLDLGATPDQIHGLCRHLREVRRFTGFTEKALANHWPDYERDVLRPQLARLEVSPPAASNRAEAILYGGAS